MLANGAENRRMDGVPICGTCAIQSCRKAQHTQQWLAELNQLGSAKHLLFVSDQLWRRLFSWDVLVGGFYHPVG